MSGADDAGNPSLRDLFRTEAESQVQILTSGLLALERNAQDLAGIEPLMRAAHSLKGAARIVGLQAVERLSHVMEDCFVAAQKGRLRLTPARVDRLLQGVDMMSQIAALPESEADAWMERNKLHIATLQVNMYEAADPGKLNDGAAADSVAALEPPSAAASVPVSTPALSPVSATTTPARVSVATPGVTTPMRREDQVLRVSARSFDRVLSLAGEARVAAHALHPQLQSLLRVRKSQHEFFLAVEQLSAALHAAGADAQLTEQLQLVRQRIGPLQEALTDRLTELDAYELRLLSVSQAMLDEVLTLRMRPFRDGVQALPRMVRDLARALGKEARLDIRGAETLVDRDILASIESALSHLLRNAVDHGLETPAQRLAAGKPREGSIVLDARHASGMLCLHVSDDGQGVDAERIRAALTARGMATAPMAAALSPSELLDFLLLPGFSLKENANEVSGRGVGLDAVQATIRQLNGTLTMETEKGRGLRTTITLPLSRSIVRAVVVDIAGEAYALPVAKIERILRLPVSEVHLLENRQFFTRGTQHVGLVSAARLLDAGEPPPNRDELAVIVIGDGKTSHGLVVDAIRTEQSLAVQPLDGMFGKLRDISSASLLENGAPVLVLDVADLLVDIDRLAGDAALGRMRPDAGSAAHRAKRVLVVDDSLTVREVERKLLQARGYAVDVAVDGMDGWNAVRSGDYDLVITDVDMPRMDGIELVRLIKQDGRLGTLPVMIVSYKDRPEDRARGIDAGADYYLTKGSFHDETLLEAVLDLIGDNADNGSESA